MEQLIAHHLSAVWAVALAIVGMPDEAEDVCQETFIRCWDRRRQCRDVRALRGWVLAIARNTAYSHARRGRARSAEPLDESLPSGRASPARAAERADLGSLLIAGMERLTPTQREVLVLRDLEGWPHGEIADQLSISNDMSRRHLSDARRRMRDYLEQAGGDDREFSG